MISAISNALSGLMSSSKQVEQTAHNIANATTPREGDQIDLSEEAVNLKIAETSYKANLAAIKTANEMNNELLHIFDEEV